MKDTITQLENIIAQYTALLQALDEEAASQKPLPEKWSKKELLGHLIDSAQNNIRRFIAGQYEDKPQIRYDQDFWVNASNYKDYPWIELCRLWILLNMQIVRILNNIPEGMEKRQVNTGALRSIEWLAADYCKHLLHHLHQVLDMEKMDYP
jgi:hypothetical protein